MNKYSILIFTIIVFFMIGCSTNREINTATNELLIFRIQGGVNHGGIVENTDMDVVPNAPVDGFSGATRTGCNMGVRVIKPFRGNAIETGIDLMINHQKFIYNDFENHFIGTRDISVIQFMTPALWNISLFKKNHPLGLFQLKAGPILQFNLLNFSHQGELPAYSYNRLSAGVSVGLSSAPLHLGDSNGLGFFMEGYRGSQIYKDFYNKSSYEMPGSSFVKMGVIYQFNHHSKK